MFGITEKQEFLHALKYTECHYCCATMFCKFGCMEPDYPQGLRDYKHPRWEEIINVYLEYHSTEEHTDTDALRQHVKECRKELKRREDGRD